MVVMVMELATFWGLSTNPKTPARYLVHNHEWKDANFEGKDKGSDYGTDNILEALLLSGLM